MLLMNLRLPPLVLSIAPSWYLDNELHFAKSIAAKKCSTDGLDGCSRARDILVIVVKRHCRAPEIGALCSREYATI